MVSVSSLEGPKSINDTPQALYLDLMESCLLNLIYEDAATAMNLRGDLLAFNGEKRRSGRDWPSMAHTMMGQLRRHNLRELATTVIKQNIPGQSRQISAFGCQVVFLKGWFKDTLPAAPIAHLALLHLDGDMYESTMDALQALYHKVSLDGFVMVDDYGSVPACKRAIHDFRTAWNISDPMIAIDHDCVYWHKT